MIIEAIKLKNFRNFSEANITSLSSGLNIFQGANGSGKSNLLEAISLSSLGKCCRGALDREMVKFGAKAATVDINGIVQKKKLVSNLP